MLEGGSIDEKSILGWILSTLPTLTCILLFLSPIPAVKMIIKDQSTKNLPALPYISMFVQCLYWATYGFLISSFTVFVPNGIGVMLSFLYVYIYYKHAVDVQLVHQLLLGAAIAIIGFIFLVLKASDKERTVGNIAMISTILFIFSPLASIFEVCATRSVAAMPFHLSFLTVCNATCWLGFGWLVQNDFTIWVPNILGFISGCLQLVCHALFGDIQHNLYQMRNSFSIKQHQRKALEQFDPFEDLDFESDTESITLH